MKFNPYFIPYTKNLFQVLKRPNSDNIGEYAYDLKVMKIFTQHTKKHKSEINKFNYNKS